MTRPPPNSPLFPSTPLSRSPQPSKPPPQDPPVLRSPVGNVLERTCLEPAGPPLRFVSPRDQSRALQHLKVLGDGRHADRKSTRLNSSHGYISYAVFCLKKKKKHQQAHITSSNA